MPGSAVPHARHVVLATIGSLGDLHPMIALGLELERRGHRASIATTEAYRQKIVATGLAFHPLRPDLAPDDPELARQVMDLKKGPEFIIRELFMPHLAEMYADLESIAVNADYLVAGELVFPAPLLAEKYRRRWASVILSPLSFFSICDPSVIAPLPFARQVQRAPGWVQRLILALGKRMGKSWCKPVKDLRGELGLSAGGDPLFEDKFSPSLNLALFSPLLAVPQPDWPPNTLQTGFVFYDKQEHEASELDAVRAFMAAGKAPVVFTLGSAAVLDAGLFYEQSAEAAEKLNRRALLLVGKNLPRRALPPQIAAFGYAPFSEILPQAACVVHQGGVGTTAQVLRAGVPQLVMPYGFDQPDNAARMERAGVALTIARRDYTAERACALLTQLLADPGYARRAAELAQRLRAEDGLTRACDAIEAQMRLGGPL